MTEIIVHIISHVELTALFWRNTVYRVLNSEFITVGATRRSREGANTTRLDCRRCGQPLAGVNTRKVSSIALMVSATIATIVGIVFTMRIGAASIDVGMPYLLPSFAAAFLGATQFKEGNVNVPGTIVAVYVLATGVKGVQLMGAPYWIEDLFFGLALLIAVGLAVRSGRQRSM